MFRIEQGSMELLISIYIYIIACQSRSQNSHHYHNQSTRDSYPRSSVFQCFTIDEMSSFGSVASSSKFRSRPYLERQRSTLIRKEGTAAPQAHSYPTKDTTYNKV